MLLAYRTVTRLCFVFALGILTLPMIAQKQVRIAAASDLTPVMPALAAQYENETGVHIVASFGSSATLTEQIRSGAPFDVFLSADTIHPLQVVQGGQADSAAPVPYARGVLVLWARKDSPAQPIRVDALQHAAVQKIAIANPAHAPYGLAAQQFLQHVRLWDVLQAKLVVAENIAQAAQFAESGNAQAGFISLTTANTPHFRATGTFVVLPQEAYTPIVQAGVVLKAAPDLEAARAFLRWLSSAAVQAKLEPLGLHPAH
jgi:molybdate transport system substrate-binding protein